MKLLLLGGPRFVGRALIEAALARGHEVTTFNRGQTNPGAYPEVEELHGDRHDDLHLLDGRSWDAVLDTSAYVPQVVRSAAGLLAARSSVTCSSRRSRSTPTTAATPEDAPWRRWRKHPDDALLPDYANYGPLKAPAGGRERFPGRALIVRLG